MMLTPSRLQEDVPSVTALEENAIAAVETPQETSQQPEATAAVSATAEEEMLLLPPSSIDAPTAETPQEASQQPEAAAAPASASAEEDMLLLPSSSIDAATQVPPNPSTDAASPPILSVEERASEGVAVSGSGTTAEMPKVDDVKKLANFFEWHNQQLANTPPPTDGLTNARRKRPAAKSLLPSLNSGPMTEMQGMTMDSTDLAQLDDDDFPIAYAFHLYDPESERIALAKQDESDMAKVGRNNKEFRKRKANEEQNAAVTTSTGAKGKKRKFVAAAAKSKNGGQAKQRSSLENLPAPKKPKAANKSPKRKSESSSGKGNAREKAVEISSGPPDEPIQGGWPEGWIKKVVQRASGESKGHCDRYWYSPINQYKFRSMAEIHRFFTAMAQTNNDEGEAWKIFKNKGG